MKHFIYTFLLYVIMCNMSYAQITQALPMRDTLFKLKPLDKQISKLQHSEARHERAKKKAIAQMKLKNGCVGPDRNKIAAAKIAVEKYKK